MKKILLGAALTLALSSPIFALHGEGYKILSESHKVLGENAKGSFETNCEKSQNVKYAHAGAQTYDAKGHVKDYIGLQGSHFYIIRNDTGRAQRYKVHLSIDCIGASNVHDFELELRPGGWVDEAAKNFLTVQPTQKGQSTITAITEIFGESHQRATGGKTLRVN